MGLREHPPREQTTTMSLHQSFFVDSLMLRALIRTASGKGGGRNTETEVTTRAWHDGLQKLRLNFFNLFMQWLMRMITDDAMELHFSLRLLDRVTDHACCHIIIPASTRPGNCSTCSVGQEQHSKTHPWSEWSTAVWFQPSHWARSTPSSG